MRFPNTTTAVLHRNVGHREACLAIYRRLLAHTRNVADDLVSFSSSLPNGEAAEQSSPHNPPPLSRTLKSIITREFRKHNNVDPKVSSVRAALLLANKAERCLRLATANPPDPIEVARITAFINLYRQAGEAPLRRMQAANITIQPAPKPKPTKQISPYIQKLPQELRHKPSLLGGNTIPHIRYTGTRQPASLSGMLNKMLKRKIKREERLEYLTDLRSMALAEDAFEDHLRVNADEKWRKEEQMDKSKWSTVVIKTLNELRRRMFVTQVVAWQRSGENMKKMDEFRSRRGQLLKRMKSERAKEKEMAKYSREERIVKMFGRKVSEHRPPRIYFLAGKQDGDEKIEFVTEMKERKQKKKKPSKKTLPEQMEKQMDKPIEKPTEDSSQEADKKVDKVLTLVRSNLVAKYFKPASDNPDEAPVAFGRYTGLLEGDMHEQWTKVNELGEYYRFEKLEDEDEDDDDVDFLSWRPIADFTLEHAAQLLQHHARVTDAKEQNFVRPGKPISRRPIVEMTPKHKRPGYRKPMRVLRSKKQDKPISDPGERTESKSRSLAQIFGDDDDDDDDDDWDKPRKPVERVPLETAARGGTGAGIDDDLEDILGR
ncbi:hypothetical protein H072_5376 [Dactylellina haptotyla CBS 200.50]|uniref:Uncharacterized protein n=1 Tax=Dactylellina haptotyla (strain CBS 200.50) TaxID=1284197 RepID=S8BMK1_DACHA|nr:hypothetical protein H072_5376 [Dactylellina haptotyla CBS 200.50]